MSAALGIDVGGTTTKVTLLQADDTVTTLDAFPTLGEKGPASFIDRLGDHLDGVEFDRRAVGFAIAGLITFEGRIAQAPNLNDFVDVDFGPLVEARLGAKRVVIENDVNAGLIGEQRLGAARGSQHVVMLALGTGVGGALVLDGRLYRGSLGLGGELGHTLIDHEGPRCACGLRGHVESYLSTESIVDHARERLAAAAAHEGPDLRRRLAGDQTPTPRVLSESAHAGDPLAAAILGDLGRILGIAVGNLVNVFNPDKFVIGGGVAGSGKYLLDPARKEMLARAMPTPGGHVELVAAQLGTNGAAVGAAVLARDALLTV